MARLICYPHIAYKMIVFAKSFFDGFGNARPAVIVTADDGGTDLACPADVDAGLRIIMAGVDKDHGGSRTIVARVEIGVAADFETDILGAGEIGEVFGGQLLMSPLRDADRVPAIVIDGQKRLVSAFAERQRLRGIAKQRADFDDWARVGGGLIGECDKALKLGAVDCAAGGLRAGVEVEEGFDCGAVGEGAAAEGSGAKRRKDKAADAADGFGYGHCYVHWLRRCSLASST